MEFIVIRLINKIFGYMLIFNFILIETICEELLSHFSVLFLLNVKYLHKFLGRQQQIDMVIEVSQTF